MLRYRYSASGTLAEREETAEQGLQVFSRSQQFEHDAVGRLLSRTTADSHLAYHYDEADRLTAIERRPSTAGKALGLEPERLAFAYDASGRLTEEHSAQDLLGYQYDALGNLTTWSCPTATSSISCTTAAAMVRLRRTDKRLRTRRAAPGNPAQPGGAHQLLRL